MSTPRKLLQNAIDSRLKSFAEKHLLDQPE